MLLLNHIPRISFQAHERCNDLDFLNTFLKNNFQQKIKVDAPALGPKSFRLYIINMYNLDTNNKQTEEGIKW